MEKLERSKIKLQISFYLVLVILGIMIINNKVNSTTYRTPGRTRAVSYSPMTWRVGDYREFLQHAADSQHYEFDYMSVEEDPDPGSPNYGLEHLLWQIRYEGNIGILRINTKHSALTSRGFFVEVYGDQGRELRDAALNRYLTNPFYGFTENHLIADEEIVPLHPELNIYAITLTYDGIRHITHNLYPDSLDEAIIFLSMCYSDRDFYAWRDALSVAGYDGIICGHADEYKFWQRMNGTRDRVTQSRLFGFLPIYHNTNKNRSVKHAASGIIARCYSGGRWHEARIQWAENGNVVLSPIVIKHHPKKNRLMGGSGYVKFDCKMNTAVDADEIVWLTGTGIYEANLTGVQWASNSQINFNIPLDELEGYCCTDFLVYADNAQSYYNHNILLDGNTDPPRSDGQGKNEDHYTWTSKVHNYPMVTFEDLDELETIRLQFSNAGMEFHDGFEPSNPEHHYLWQSRIPVPESTVYPYHYNVEHPIFWQDGMSAWMGDRTELTARGTITFPYGGTMGLCVSVTSDGPLILEGWNHLSPGSNIYQRNIPWTILEGFPRTRSMYNKNMVAPVEYGVFDRVTFEQTENTWAIDNLMPNNIVGRAYTWFEFEPFLYYWGPDSCVSGREATSMPFIVEDIVDSLLVGLYWDVVEGLDMSIELRNPDNEVVFEEQASEHPIIMDEPILDPIAGEWVAKVNANSSFPQDVYYFVFFTKTSYEPLVDGYFVGEDDIKWYPTDGEMGDLIVISAMVHAGD